MGKREGYFFQTENYEDLALKIQTILENPEIYKKLKNECKQQYELYKGI
ncbi:hypothetical protein [Methanobrevibacter arboriphilus]|nr:hypothetical protein [Methanobrevibacter arboriphilus]